MEMGTLFTETLIFSFLTFTLLYGKGNLTSLPINDVNHVQNDLYTESPVKGSFGIPASNKSSQITSKEFICPTTEITPESYVILDSDHIFVPSDNVTYESSEYKILDGRLCILFNATYPNVPQDTYPNVENCTRYWFYEPEEFKILKNGSAMLYLDDGYEIIDQNAFVAEGDRLKMCAEEYDYSNLDSEIDEWKRTVLIYIGKAGTTISIICLFLHIVLHIIVFYRVPSLRNLPAYNLMSMSVAYLIAYSFIIIGQIQSVLGVFCVASGVIVQYFMLAAFFWMNVMTIDVWWALRLATLKFASISKRIKASKCACYSIYAWCTPAIFSIVSLAVEVSPSFPDDIKPGYGRDDDCWITNDRAKLIFFVGPAFALFLGNIFFFIACTYMISKHTMKKTCAKQMAARSNFLLYVRLGLIMGVTWSIGIIGVIMERKELWLIFDILNSLQGFFVFLFFSCSRKMWTNLKKSVLERFTRTTITAKSNS